MPCDIRGVDSSFLRWFIVVVVTFINGATYTGAIKRCLISNRKHKYNTYYLGKCKQCIYKKF